MKHPININVLNNAVGIPPTADGIVGILAKSVAVAGKFILNRPYLLTQLDDLVTILGIDAAYDTTNNTAVYQQVSEFYGQAGDGALLWLYGVPKNTVYAAFVATSTFSDFIRYTAQADPLQRVKMIGLCYDVPLTLQSAADFPVDVTDTILALETVRAQLFQQGYQFSALIDGYNMSSTVAPSALTSLATRTQPGISLCIAGTKGNGVSGIGLALGRFARITVGRGFSAVEDGAVNTNTAFLTNSVLIPVTGNLVVGEVYTVFGGNITYNAIVYKPGDVFVAVVGQIAYTTTAGGYVVSNSTPINGAIGTPAIGLSPSSIDQLGLKQYMFLRTWSGKSGFYWNDAATCTGSQFALSSQEYNRVANRLSADALSFFIQEMGKNLPLDTRTGNVDQTYLNAKQEEFYNTYIVPLAAKSGSGDITDASLLVTGVNFLATKTLDFTLTIVPSVILGGVTGKLRFSATL